MFGPVEKLGCHPAADLPEDDQRTTIARWNMSARIAAKLRSHWLLGTLSGKDTEVGRSENSSFPLKDPSGWLVGFRTLFHSELFKEMEHAAPNIQKT